MDIEHLILSPVGSRPADKALTGVEESDADCVIVLVGSYACAVKTVYERVRRRFGKRERHDHSCQRLCLECNGQSFLDRCHLGLQRLW